LENVFGHKNDKDELNTKNQNELSQLLCSDENTSQHSARVNHGEVRTAVRSLMTGKSPGLDLIFNEHIIYGGESATHLLCHLYNAVLRSEHIPDQWQTSVIIPLYKGKGKDKAELNNYRPITLIPCICKLFEKVMLNRINKFIKTQSINFPNRQ